MKYIHVFILVLLVSMIASCKDETPSNPQNSTKDNVKQSPKDTTNNPPADPEIKANPIAGVDFITEKDGKKYYSFRLKMTRNESRKHEVYNVTRISHKISGVEKASNFVSLIELAETPISRGDDKITLRIENLSFEKAIESDGEKKVIVKTSDKQNTYDEFQTRVYNAVIEEPILIHLNSLSKIEQIEGGDRIVTAVLKSLYGDILEDNPEFDAAKDQFEKIFSEHEFKQTYDEGYFKLPFEEVAVGDTWQDNIVINVRYVGYIAFKLTLTLKKVEKIDDNFIATIELTGKYNENSDNNKLGASIGITESNYHGSIDFNLTDGSYGHFIRKVDLKVTEIDENDKATKYEFVSGKEEKVSIIDKNETEKDADDENSENDKEKSDKPENDNK